MIIAVQRERPTNDTGLHISMRLLLGIIAGLLISDALKATVKRIVGDAPVCCPAWPDALVTSCALIFIGRVVVDNVLYYHEIDPITGRRYATRVTLILLDLLSYALCYATVALLEPGTPFARLATLNVVLSLGALTAVEVLYLWWCQFAIVALRNSAALRQRGRLILLKKWLSLCVRSAVAGAIAFAALLFYRDDTVTPAIALIFATYTISSAMSSLIEMRSGYLRRREK